MSASPSKFERLREAREAARSRLDLSFAPDLPVSEAAAELREDFVPRVALYPVEPAAVHGGDRALHVDQIVFAQTDVPSFR